MDDKVRFKNRIRITDYVKPPKTHEVPVGLIEKCFSDDQNMVKLSIEDLFNYIYNVDDDDEFESFCQSFPYDNFLQLILLLPNCKSRQRALLIFSDCSRSDFFPSEQYSTDMELLSFFYSLLDSQISDEVSSSLQILSQIMLKCPPVCKFLVEEQKLHQKLEFIDATPYLSKTLAILSEVHPESLELTLKIIPYCLQTNDYSTILYSLFAMRSALRNVPDCSPVIINLIDRYSKNLFSYDIDNIDESGPYPDSVIITSEQDQNPNKEENSNKEENIHLLLEIISLIPEAPLFLLPKMIFILTKCKRDDTILLCNFALRKHKESWRGDLMIDDFLCIILQGMMENLTYELQKSCFQTILVYYQWENEFNKYLTKQLVRFLSDNDLKSACLFILCLLLEVFIAKKSSQEMDEDLIEFYKIIETAIPCVEKIIDSDANDEDSALAQKFLDLLHKEENPQ